MIRATPTRRSPPHATPLALLALLALVAPAHGALPPGYGGELRLPAPSAVTTPRANDATPFGTTVSAAVFDGLYALDDDGRIVPRLAAALPELTAEGELVVVLRENVRRHDRRTLRALDVARALQRASRETPHWLVGFAFDGDALDVRPLDERRLRFVPDRALATPALTLARRLAAAPLAIDLGRGVGTGPYRASIRAGLLELRAFRTAARGAPFVDVIRFEPPRRREDELRAFELRQIDASWQGAAVYGQGDASVREHVFPSDVAVLLVPGPALASARLTLDRALDRRRFARVGVRPSERLAEGLPPPRATGDRPLPTRLRMLVREGDAFEAALASALAARFDELGVSLTAFAISSERYERERTSADLHVAYVVPPLPGSDVLVAAARFAVTKDPRAASRALDATPELVASEAAALPALVLGHRARTLHHRDVLRGVSHDALGRLRLERLFLPRASHGAEDE